MENIVIGDYARVVDSDNVTVVDFGRIKKISNDWYTIDNENYDCYKIDNKNYFLKKYKFTVGEQILMQIDNCVVITEYFDQFFENNSNVRNFVGGGTSLSSKKYYSNKVFPLKLFDFENDDFMSFLI